MLKLKLYH